jgi:hypothetical protein
VGRVDKTHRHASLWESKYDETGNFEEGDDRVRIWYRMGCCGPVLSKQDWTLTHATPKTVRRCERWELPGLKHGAAWKERLGYQKIVNNAYEDWCFGNDPTQTSNQSFDVEGGLWRLFKRGTTEISNMCHDDNPMDGGPPSDKRHFEWIIDWRVGRILRTETDQAGEFGMSRNQLALP